MEYDQKNLTYNDQTIIEQNNDCLTTDSSTACS